MNTWAELRPHLRRPDTDDIKQCGAWLAFTLLGGLVPLWGTYVLTLVQNRPSALYDYVGHAEFALYAAATTSSALFVIFRDLKVPFPWRSGLGIGCILLLAIALVLFSGTLTSTPPVTPQLPGSLNIGFLARSSIAVFVLSVVAAVVIFCIDLQVTAYDPRNVEEKQIDELSQAVKGEP